MHYALAIDLTAESQLRFRRADLTSTGSITLNTDNAEQAAADAVAAFSDAQNAVTTARAAVETAITALETKKAELANLAPTSAAYAGTLLTAQTLLENIKVAQAVIHAGSVSGAVLDAALVINDAVDAQAAVTAAQTVFDAAKGVYDTVIAAETAVTTAAAATPSNVSSGGASALNTAIGDTLDDLPRLGGSSKFTGVLDTGNYGSRTAGVSIGVAHNSVSALAYDTIRDSSSISAAVTTVVNSIVGNNVSGIGLDSFISGGTVNLGVANSFELAEAAVAIGTVIGDISGLSAEHAKALAIDAVADATGRSHVSLGGIAPANLGGVEAAQGVLDAAGITLEQALALVANIADALRADAEVAAAALDASPDALTEHTKMMLVSLVLLLFLRLMLLSFQL